MGNEDIISISPSPYISLRELLPHVPCVQSESHTVFFLSGQKQPIFFVTSEVISILVEEKYTRLSAKAESVRLIMPVSV